MFGLKFANFNFQWTLFCKLSFKAKLKQNSVYNCIQKTKQEAFLVLHFELPLGGSWLKTKHALNLYFIHILIEKWHPSMRICFFLQYWAGKCINNIHGGMWLFVACWFSFFHLYFGILNSWTVVGVWFCAVCSQKVCPALVWWERRHNLWDMSSGMLFVQ